jgi:hypothetical protein
MIWQKLKYQHEVFLSENIMDKMCYYLCDETTDEAIPRLKHHINVIKMYCLKPLKSFM